MHGKVSARYGYCSNGMGYANRDMTCPTMAPKLFESNLYSAYLDYSTGVVDYSMEVVGYSTRVAGYLLRCVAGYRSHLPHLAREELTPAGVE